MGTALSLFAHSLSCNCHACARQGIRDSTPDQAAAPTSRESPPFDPEPTDTDLPSPKESETQTSIFLGFAPAAVVFALIFGALVDSGVFAAVAIAGGFEALLWSTTRLFGFYIGAVAAYGLLSRYGDETKGNPSNIFGRPWYWREAKYRGILASAVGLPLLFATPVLWLVVNLVCWGLFLATRRFNIRRAPVIRLASFALVLISALTVVSFTLPAGSLHHNANPSRLLIGRVVAGLPRAVIFIGKEVPGGDTRVTGRQVGYVLNVDDQGVTLLESYPPRVWVVNVGSVVGRIPCTFRDDGWKQSIVEHIRTGYETGVTTPPCGKVAFDDSGMDPLIGSN